jgi:lysophospholipase L1-like esterase
MNLDGRLKDHVRITRTALAVLFMLPAALTLRAEEPVATAAPAKSPAPFADEIAKFVAWDRKNSFPQDAVLFVGSSSIRMWPTRESFPQWPVINRGFGGSAISNVNDNFARVVEPYHAKVIVLYAGDNDIAGGKTPQEVRDDFAAFVKLVREKQPITPIVFLSIKPSNSRWNLWRRMTEANELIRAVCEQQQAVTYLDMGTVLLGPDGQPRTELYRQDELHLSDAGYEVWSKTLAPVVQKLLEKTAAPKEEAQHGK